MRWMSAGESHGPAMGIILEGLPAGLPLSCERIDLELSRRQLGHGRGGRMRIERDQVEILAGMRHGATLGSPLLLVVRNLDHENWRSALKPTCLEPGEAPGVPVRVPRPGHADLPGSLKYGHVDLRNTLERASARETVNRVLAGAVAMQMLEPLGVRVGSFVEAVGGIHAPRPAEEEDPRALALAADQHPLRCLDPECGSTMLARVDQAQAEGDTLGGVVEVRASGVPVGLGSHVHWDRRLDGRLGAALLSLPAVKGLELGAAFEQAELGGRDALDAYGPDPGQGPPRRLGNRHGGVDGGLSTGETLWLRAAMKPLSTLRRPLPSVDLDSGAACSAHRERSDVCAVPALAVVAEHALAWELARALHEVFGADSWAEMCRRRQADQRWRHLREGSACSSR